MSRFPLYLILTCLTLPFINPLPWPQATEPPNPTNFHSNPSQASLAQAGRPLQLKITPDFIFTEHGRATINADYVSLVRPISFQNMHRSADQLVSLADHHHDICDKMDERIKNFSRFVTFPHNVDWDAAIDICQSNGMKLPEIQNHRQAHMLARFMVDEYITEVHAGVSYNRKIEQMYFISNYEEIDTTATGMCGLTPDRYSKEFKHFYNKHELKPHKAHSYYVNDQAHLNLCVNREQILPLVCEALEPASTGTNALADDCLQRNYEITSTITNVKASIASLELASTLPMN